MAVGAQGRLRDGAQGGGAEGEGLEGGDCGDWGGGPGAGPTVGGRMGSREAVPGITC